MQLYTFSSETFYEFAVLLKALTFRQKQSAKSRFIDVMRERMENCDIWLSESLTFDANQFTDKVFRTLMSAIFIRHEQNLNFSWGFLQ